MTHMRNLFCTAAVAAGILVAMPAALDAQGATTTGEIRGQITEAGVAPMQGVHVTAVNTETGFERSALTTDNGFYTLRLLPPGTYDVRAQMIGYQPSATQAVRVTAGQSSTVNLQLRVAAVALAQIEVVGARPVNVTSGAVAQTVTQQEIENLPALGRDFTDFINLSGLVAPNPETTTGGQFSIAGQRPSQTNLQIDGVDANNSFFGENRGGSRIPFVFSLESIREFQVVTNGFDVEFGNYSGGVVNVVTRGGTNEFSGVVYGNLRNEQLTSRNFLGDRPTDYQVSQYSARLSGPIVRDRAFYLVSFDGQRRREPQLPISPDEFLRERIRRDGTVLPPDSPTYNALNRFISILENRYGIDDAAAGYRPFQTSNDVITLFGRIDWTINPQHRLTVRNNFSDYTNDNEWNPNFDYMYGRSRAELLQGRSNSFVSELQSVLGENTFNVLRFQVATETRPRNGLDLRPALEVTLGTGQRAGYGGTFASFQNNMEERKFQLINNFTHVLGSHTLKLGANAIFTNIRNQFISEGAGVYNFASLDDFEAFRPTSFTRNIRADGQVPFAEFGVTEWSLYAQNEWRATQRLTATLGLRYDVQSFGDAPARVIDAERAFGIETGIAPTDPNNISPRLSLAYDVRGDGNSVVRAGAGYFYGRVPYVLGGNVEQTVLPVLRLTCTGSIADADPNAPPPPGGYGQWSDRGFDNPTTCASAVGAGGVPTYTFWNQDFEFPETFKANVGYEQQLAGGTRVSADLVYSLSTKLYTVRNLNLREAQFTLDNEGGRRVYTPAEVFTPTTAASTHHLRFTEFSNVFMNYNDGRARAFSGTFEASQRVREGTSLRGSYTYTSSYDNSSYSCCTASAGYTNPKVGMFGPNDVGGVGDTDFSWGPSNFTRNHTFILSGNSRVPYGFLVSAFWRVNSGNPFSPEQGGNLNGDGVNFNDRPFIFAPEDLPIATQDPAAQAVIRERYADYLADNACVGDYVGQIIPRNTCRQPWFNRLDMRLQRTFPTARGQRAELQVDLFNVVNGIGQLLCNREEAIERNEYHQGKCGWGKYMGVFGASRNIMTPVSYDQGTNRILYNVAPGFGALGMTGTGLNLQFQAQVALRYHF
jgi:outer membrane receptor for ferrienterochelin and colicin